MFFFEVNVETPLTLPIISAFVAAARVQVASFTPEAPWSPTLSLRC